MYTDTYETGIMPRFQSYLDAQHLKRRWKRTARRWARPYPSINWIALIVSVLAGAFCLLSSSSLPVHLSGDLKAFMLHYSTNASIFQSSNDKNFYSGSDDVDAWADKTEAMDAGPAASMEERNTAGYKIVSSGPGPLSAPKACLAMIMKNEGPILSRLFESIRGFVSEYCIVDTGSTDDTIDVLKSMDMPGLLVEEPFVDFAITRNFLLDTCRQRTTCDYLVLLDADMVLHVSPEWDWAKLDGRDAYDMIQVSSVEYNNLRIIRRSAERIKVVGATHEYYDVPDEYAKGSLPRNLVYIDDVGDGKAKGDKFERDERLLRRELEREPANVRTVFYLANTLKDQGKCGEAIPFYERRATMGGWFAEADYSLYMLSACYVELGDLENARKYGEQAAFEGAAQRAEPLYFLALYLHRQQEYDMAWRYITLAVDIPKPDVSRALFVYSDIYDYWVAYEQASLCRHIVPVDKELCIGKMEDFLNNPFAPNHLREYFRLDLEAFGRVKNQNGREGG